MGSVASLPSGVMHTRTFILIRTEGALACRGAAGAGALGAADFEERWKASEGSRFGGSSFLGVGVTSAGETRSPVIGSAVTEPNGCTSVKNSTSVTIDR